MMKLSIIVNDTVLMEQEAGNNTIASFFPDPERVLKTVERQGWYGLANFAEEEGITIMYKVVPSYSKTFLPVTQ